MGLIRDLPFAITVLEDSILVTCSAIMTTAGSTSAVGMLSAKTTASALVSTGDIGNVSATEQGARVSSGGMVTSTEAKILDRTRYPLGSHYQAVSAQAIFVSTRGSTEADGKLALGVTVFHGDSSGGGDLAELSTGMRPKDRVYGTSVRTTDMAGWDTAESSGTVYFVSNPGICDLRAAKQYIQVRPRYGKNKVTTESSGYEQGRASAIATFFAGDLLPPGLDTTSPYSTSTST
jgi:hypothetical protein